MWKRVLTWIVWIVGGLAGLVVIAYLALLAINWRDQPPSEAAQRLAAVSKNRPLVADADNGWFYLTEFSQGLADHRETRTPAAQKIAEECKFVTPACVLAFDGADVMLQWTEAEQDLLDRYLMLIRHQGWREPPYDQTAPLPPFERVRVGQQLLYAKAYLLAGQKDVAGVRELLGADARFWRRALADSDILITKMIAVARVSRAYALGNLVLRQLPAELQIDALPREWITEMTGEERSLLRAFAGEWIFSTSAFEMMLSRKDLSFGGKVTQWVAQPLFQRQDSNNRRAEMFVHAVDLMNVPFGQFPRDPDQARGLFESVYADHQPLTRFYNPVGDMLVLAAAPSFGRYGFRVIDIEGARRAAVLATQLRSRKIRANAVPAELASSSLRTPYNSDPFSWDAKERSIVFIGLQPGDRGRFTFKY